MKYELTWEDTKRLMHTAKAQMPIASSCLNNLLKHKRNGEIVQEKIDSFQQGQFSCFKDMPEELKEIQTSISFIQEEGGVKLELDPNVWMISVFFKVLKYVPDCKEKMHQTSHLFYIEGKEEYLKKIKEELINTKNLINDLIAGKKGLMCQTVDKEELKHIRKIVLWLYRNIDQVFEAYQKDLPKEILEEIDQEKLLLYLAYISYTASGLLEAEKEEEIKVEPLAYIQNYLLYVNYQKSLDPNYRPSYHDAISERSELATLSSFQRQMDNTYEACPDLLNKVDGYQTIDDLLKEVLKDLRNRIRKEQFKKDIELSWEFIPEPLKESSYHTNNHYFRKNKTEEEKDVLEQKKKEILEAKLDVFKDLPYIATLKGIDHFEGYIAYLFPNGKVIMEKFYKKVRVKKGKYALEPAINEAIYVMGIENFQTLSRQGKMEIRRYINETNDPHAKVIYHFKNFKQKVLNEITGCDYSSEVLDYVDQLIQSEKSQVYQKMREKIENNIHLVKELLAIDEQIMKEHADIESLLDVKPFNFPFQNSLIIYDGNPKTTIKIIESGIENSLLYPNHSFLAINKFFVNDYNHLHLILELNDFKYQLTQDVFDHIIVIGPKEVYEELKLNYQNIIYMNEE